MVPGRIFRFVGMLLLLIQNDEAGGTGGKHRTSGAYHHFGFAAAHPFPLVIPLSGRQAGMQHRHLVAKIGCQKAQQLGCQRNFGNQKHSAFVLLQSRLYQLDINSNEHETALQNFFDEYDFTKGDKAYITEVVNGVFSHIEEIDTIIVEATKSWTLNRISLVDKAILRLAVYEMYYREDIPDSISIYEAVELAKLYDSPKAGGFVNGLLRGILRKKEGEPEGE